MVRHISKIVFCATTSLILVGWSHISYEQNNVIDVAGNTHGKSMYSNSLVRLLYDSGYYLSSGFKSGSGGTSHL